MKHSYLFVSAFAALLLASCGGKCNCNCGCQNCTCSTDSSASKDTAAYTVVEKPQFDISKLPKDKDGFITIFDGKTLTGWRCYGKDKPGSDWNVDDGAIHLKGSGNGEG